MSRKRLNVIKVPTSNSNNSRRKDIAIHEDDFEVFKVISSCGTYCIDAVDENKRICSLSVHSNVREGRKELPADIWRLSALKQLKVDSFLLGSPPVGLSQNLEELEIGSKSSRPYHLPKEIDHLVNLKKLVLKEGICSPPNSIGNLNKLEWLEISIVRTNIHEIPEEIGDLTNLKHLSLIDSSRLASLPASIGNLNKLEWLEISIVRTNIQELPNEIGNLTNLKYLGLFDMSRLASLPTSIGSLKKLEKICIFNSIIQELPNEIGDLTNLNVLKLIRTPISSLPRSIGNLKELKTIYIDEANIQELPKEIGELENLNVLELEGTPISSLPVSIGNLKKLEVLKILLSQDFSAKSFWIPKELWGLSALRKLVFFGVKGTSISIPPSIEALQNLKELYLKGDITISKEIGNMKRLTVLCLDSPKEWQSIPFESMQELQLLEIRKEFLFSRMRHSNFIRVLSNLKFLYVIDFPETSPEQDTKDLILDLVQASPSLSEINHVFEKQPQTAYALACNRGSLRMRSFCRRYDESPLLLRKLWPRLLSNATSAFERLFFRKIFEDAGHTLNASLLDHDEDHISRKNENRIEMHDAVYRILVDGRGSFVQTLLDR